MQQRFQSDPSVTPPALERVRLASTPPDMQTEAKQTKTIASREGKRLQRIPRNGRTRRCFSLRWLLAACVAFFVLPWCPPAPQLTLFAPPAGPSANAFYAELKVAPGTALQGKKRPPHNFGNAEWQQWRTELSERPGEHVLPTNLREADGLRTVEQLERHVAKNAAVLKRLPEALALPYTDGGIHDTRTYVGGTVRDLVMTLRHQSWLAAGAGEHAQAAQAALTSLALAQQVARARTVMSWSLGEFARGQALDALEVSAPKLQPAEARAVLAELERCAKTAPTLAQALAGERDLTARSLSFYRYPGTEVRFLSRIPLVRLAGAQLVQRYEEAMNRRIAAIERADSSTAAELQQAPASYDPVAPFLYPLDRFYSEAQAKNARLAALRTLLKTRSENP